MDSNFPRVVYFWIAHTSRMGIIIPSHLAPSSRYAQIAQCICSLVKIVITNLERDSKIPDLVSDVVLNLEVFKDRTHEGGVLWSCYGDSVSEITQ